MGVRVRLKLKLNDKSAECSALVNSGFETDDPEIVLPPVLAEVLGVEPSYEHSSYSVAGGGTASAVRGSKAITVGLLLSDRASREAVAVPSIMPGEEEVIISDRLAHELGVVVLDPYEGEWCLRDELGKVSRSSARPEYWK